MWSTRIGHLSAGSRARRREGVGSPLLQNSHERDFLQVDVRRLRADYREAEDELREQKVTFLIIFLLNSGFFRCKLQETARFRSKNFSLLSTATFGKIHSI